MNREFISFSELLQEYDLEKRATFGDISKLKTESIRGKFHNLHVTNPVRDFLEVPDIANRAAVFYQVFSRLNKGICRSLTSTWQRNLECELGKDGGE